MKPTKTLAALLVAGPLAVVAACAQGTTPATSDDGTEEPTTPAGDGGKSSSSSSSGGSSTSSSGGESSTSSSGSTSSSSSGGSSGASSSGATSSSSSGGSSGSSSSGSTSSSSGSTSSSSGSTGDAGTCKTTAPSNACGLAPQCGCAANQTCDVINANGTVGCVSAGTGAQGSSCTSTSQCAAGLTCAYNACRPYCPKAGTACTATGTGTCYQFYDASENAVTNATVCTITCDPRTPSAACGTNTCIFDPTLPATDCDKAGTKVLYAACSKYNDCKPGLACVSHPVYGFECESWCRVGHDSDCSGLDVCEDVYGANAPKIGSDKLGHCQ